MESAVHNFSNYLEDSVKRDSPKEAGKLIKHVRKYLDDNVGDNTLTFAIAKIYDEPYNLFKFLVQIKDKANQTGWKEVLSDSLELLLHFLTNFYKKLSQFVLQIINVCRTISISNCQANEKSKAINILCHILKNDSDIPMDDISIMYDDYFQFCRIHQKATSAKVQKSVFILLGIISNKYPYIIKDHNNLIEMYILLLKRQSECSEKERDNIIVSGCIDGLSNVLETFPITNEDTNAKIYHIISKLLLSGSTRFDIRDVVKFISRHCSMLIENIYKDVPELWFETIKKWALSVGENQKAGYIALEKFYEELAKHLKSQTDQKAQNCFQFFFNYFLRLMKDEKADIIEVRLAIRGFGYFSVPCNTDQATKQKNLSQMFMIIVNRIEQDYFVQENPSMEQLEYLPDYIHCFSTILFQIGEYTFDQIDSLQQISVLMIKTFPKLSVIYYFSVFDSLILSMCYLYENNPKYLENYLQKVVYQGVLWTCSHRTPFELEINEDNKIITYKNYLPLWRNLLNFVQSNNSKYYDICIDVKTAVVQLIYDELIKTLLLLINKLNLNTKSKDDIFDPQVNCEAEKIDDFIIFINVVDFYIDLLSSVNNDYFKKWIKMYINQIIMLSTKFPYISGYYKLLQLGLKIAEKLKYFDEIDKKEDRNILHKKLLSYLEKVLHNVHEYKDDLQISCLQLLLTIPLSFVPSLLPTFTPIFEMSLNVGRGYLKLAETAVDTLEKWHKFVPIHDLKPLLKDVLPNLDPFLRSKGFVGDPDIKLSLLEKKSKRTKKRKVIIEQNSELANLQNKILMFTGQLDSEICLYLIKTDVEIDQVTWEKQPYLKFTLPYTEIRPNIYLDRIIPRILELALSSGDQKTRITACELLHSVVIFMLGTSRQMSLSELIQLKILFRKIMLPVIELGCDSNDVVRQLFNPLVFQIIHWYSSPLQLMSAETSVLIDILMDGISHPNNTSVRDLSGKCIKEFVIWTIKQCRAEDLEKNSQNIHIIVNKICSFCLHPNRFKRLGAALAFNHLYTHLREEMGMVDIYWIELAYSLMINMSLEEINQNTAQLEAALNHIERVLREKNNIFNKHSLNRRIPKEIDGPFLKDFLLWILKQTASNNTNYRRKSIKLFCNLAPYAENCGSVKNFITKFIQNENWYIDKYETGLRDLSRLHTWDKLGSVEIIFKYLQNLLKTLDTYKYLSDYDIINFKIFFNNTIILDSLRYFITKIVGLKLEECLKLFKKYDTDYICLPEENDEFYRLKSLIIIAIFDYLLSILDKSTLWCENFCQEHFWEFISACVFKPNSLGFTVDDDEILAEKLTQIFNKIIKKLPQNLVKNLVDYLSNYFYQKYDKNINFNTNIVPLSQRNILKGWLLIKNFDLKNKIVNDGKYFENSVELIFKSLIKDGGQKCGVMLTSTVWEYANLHLKLCLNSNSPNVLCDSITNCEKIKHPEIFTPIIYGEYFLNTFKETIMEYIIINNKNCIKLLGCKWNNFHDNSSLIILINILKYLSTKPQLKQKINMADFLENVVYAIYHVYKSSSDLTLKERNFQIELLSHVIRVDGNKSAEIGRKYEFIKKWFLEQLNYYPESEIAKVVLQFHTNVLCFLPCFTDPSNEEDFELESSLDAFTKKTLNHPKDKLDNSDLLVLLKKLLDLLTMSKSKILLKPCMDILTTLIYEEENINIGKYLNRYLSSISPDQQYESIKKIYEHCCTLNPTNKYKITKIILLTMLRFCKYDVFEEFFVQNIKTIMTNLKLNLNSENCASDIIEKSVSLILVDALFSRIKISNFADKSCPISKTLYTLEKGNELFKECLEIVNQIFKENLKFEDDRKELYRFYHCDAFKCLASIVCNSKNPKIDALWFRKLFFISKEDKNIWRNIINIEENISVPQDFDKIPSRKKVFVSIRNEHQKSQQNPIHYIESQSLFNSTLSEDICKFDFTNTLVRSPDFQEETNSINERTIATILLKSVDYNNHECMPTMCALIEHIFEEKISVLPTEKTDIQNAVLPLWMDDIKKLILDSNVAKNIRIFIARVIHNTQHIFKSYAKYFFEAVVKFVTDKCTGDGINYFVADLVLMLISWLENLDLSEIKNSASELVNFLMENSSNDRQDMLKYNLEIIKTSVQIWKSVLVVHHEIIFNKLQHNNIHEKLVGIHLSGILLANDLIPWTLENVDSIRKTLTGILNKERLKKVFKPCAELIGMMLKYMENKNEYKKCFDLLNKELDEILKKPNSDKLFNSLEQIQIHYPNIMDRYLRKISMLAFMEKDPVLKCISLKNVLRRIDQNDAKRYTYRDIIDLLSVEDNDVRLLTLQIANKMILDFKKQLQISVINSVIEQKSDQNSMIRYAVYEILMTVYTAYSEEKDLESIELIKLCKPVLLSALIDSDFEIQEKVENFWYNKYQNLKITEKYEQFLIGMYSPDVENFYLGCMNYFLLDSCKDSPEYKKLMFGHPLSDCKFDDYQVLYNWRLQNSSIAPLFSSFAKDISAPELVGLRETNSLKLFTPTLDFSSSIQTSSSFLFESTYQTKNYNKNTLTREETKTFGRIFLPQKTRMLVYAKKETEKNVEIEKERKERVKRKEGNVVMYRQYRKGDFPDIQIPFSALIDPLKILAKRDGTLARQLYVMLFSGLVDELENSKSFIKNFNEGILSIFDQSYMYVPNVIGAFLDASFENNKKKNIRKIIIQSDVLSNVCKNSGLLPIGCLLMEEYVGMEDDLPSGAKRGCGRNDNEVKQWVKLADMYKELNEWDAVIGIFSSKMNCSSDISSAITLEANCDWKEALSQYEDLLNTDTDSNRKDFYYESYFKCFANLSDWKNMSRTVDQLSESNYFDGDWNQEKLLPWYMMAEVNLMLEKADENSIIDNLNKWMKEKDKSEYLKEKFCEELAILSLIQNDAVSSKHYATYCFIKFLEDWSHLNPLFTKIRSKNLLNFQKVVDLNKYLTHKNPTDLINYWQNSNLSSYTLPLTEIRSLFRQQFISSLENKLQSSQEEFSTDLKSIKLSCGLNLVENAVQSKNYIVGRKYCKESKKYISADNKLGNFKLLLAASKVGYILAEKHEEVNKLNTLTESWTRLDTICRKYNNNFIDLQIESSNEIFKITQSIHNTFKESPESYSTIKTKIEKLIHSELNFLSDLQNYGINKLRNAIFIGENFLEQTENSKVLKSLMDTYLNLTIFAQSQESDDYHEDIVKCVLKAMKLGSRDARQIFPCLLQFPELGGKLLDVFKNESESVPTWMFLLWIPQLLITLNSCTKAVENIVERLSLTYPQALIYSYRLAREKYDLENANRDFKTIIKTLDNILNNKLVDDFLEAISYVCIPELYFNYHLDQIVKNYSDCNEIRKQINILAIDLRNRIQKQKNFKSIENCLNNLEENIKGVQEFDEMKNKIHQIVLINKTHVIPSGKLKHYSSWLADFKSADYNSELEIPGQYSGESRPIVKYHAKISSFNQKISCKIKSLRKAFEIVIFGNDSKEYSFLVKFGEDLRQDQRIQQLFSLANNILQSDKHCQERQLFLEQYQIIPLTKSLGLIKVVENTKPFSDFIFHHEKDQNTLKKYDEIKFEYIKWIRDAAKGAKLSDAEFYAKAVLTYDSNEVNMMFNRFVNAIPADVLSKSFWSITMSPSNYTYLRHQFITSYSVMCVAHWLLGIGDRNLGNTLISLKTGRAVGIDFGYAFGTMTQHSPIPELIPFRLTPHILALMEPLRETGFVEMTMVHVLKALREKRHLLLSTMDVFIKDPSVDWLEYSKTHQTESQESEIQWHPNFKIDIATKKLNGANPSFITIRELRHGVIFTNHPQICQAYVDVIEKDKTKTRNRFKYHNLSEEDQVKCLLDQAMDYNILGRQYAGLQLWI